MASATCYKMGALSLIDCLLSSAYRQTSRSHPLLVSCVHSFTILKLPTSSIIHRELLLFQYWCLIRRILLCFDGLIIHVPAFCRHSHLCTGSRSSLFLSAVPIKILSVFLTYPKRDAYQLLSISP